MKKLPIGILDMNNDNIAVVNYLAASFPHEDFVYVYDPDCMQYEGLALEEIQLRVQNNLNYLITRQAKLIICVSSTIVEYAMDLLEEVHIPVINIFDTIIDAVNKDFEHKNMLVLADEAILQSNIYQKKIKYNHLYSISCDSLNQIVRDQKTKTSESFKIVNQLSKNLKTKDIDLIVPTNINLILLKTEILEFLNECEFLEVGEILVEKTKAALLTVENLESRGRGYVEFAQIVGKLKNNYRKIIQVKRIKWCKNK